jgi:hypothetical protein
MKANYSISHLPLGYWAKSIIYFMIDIIALLSYCAFLAFFGTAAIALIFG